MKKTIWMTLLGCLCFGASTHAADTLNVAVTQAFFADLVREIGRENVNVHVVAPPKFNVHFVQPRPSDVKKVSGADLYVSAGLDLEAWSDPLLEAAGKPRLFRGAERHLDLSKGIALLDAPAGRLSRSEGDLHLYGNPHFHMNPENARIMAHSIADKLKQVDAKNADGYEKNAAEFLTRLETKLAEWKSLCSNCAGKEIISYHDDIAYFTGFLGLSVHAFIEPKPGIPPTARHLAMLESDIKARGIRVLVQPSYYPTDTAEHLAEKTGARTVLIAQNAGELPGTETFFGFFDRNIRTIGEALK